MKNRIKKSYKLETIYKALIITNLINMAIKRLGLPILVVLLSLFFFQISKGNTTDKNLDNIKIEQMIRQIP